MLPLFLCARGREGAAAVRQDRSEAQPGSTRSPGWRTRPDKRNEGYGERLPVVEATTVNAWQDRPVSGWKTGTWGNWRSEAARFRRSDGYCRDEDSTENWGVDQVHATAKRATSIFGVSTMRAHQREDGFGQRLSVVGAKAKHGGCGTLLAILPGFAPFCPCRIRHEGLGRASGPPGRNGTLAMVCALTTSAASSRMRGRSRRRTSSPPRLSTRQRRVHDLREKRSPGGDSRRRTCQRSQESANSTQSRPAAMMATLFYSQPTVEASRLAQGRAGVCHECRRRMIGAAASLN